MDLAKVVSTKKIYDWSLSTWTLGRGYQVSSDNRYHVVAYDYGIKKNILKTFNLLAKIVRHKSISKRLEEDHE